MHADVASTNRGFDHGNRSRQNASKGSPVPKCGAGYVAKPCVAMQREKAEAACSKPSLRDGPIVPILVPNDATLNCGQCFATSACCPCVACSPGASRMKMPVPAESV